MEEARAQFQKDLDELIQVKKSKNLPEQKSQSTQNLKIEPVID